MVQATGNYEATKKDAIAEAVINIVASIILINLIGINGVIIGTIIANIYRTVRYAYFTDKNIISRGILVFIKRIIWCASAVVINIWLSSLLNKLIVFSENWFGWIVQGVLVLIISLIITLLLSICIYRNEVSSFFKVIKRMIFKR